MLSELFLFAFLGILSGTVTGLIPGLHINTICVMLLGLFYTHSFEPLLLSVFIITMGVTHTITDFIPSIFLGVPDPSTAMSILPAHKMLLKGRGYEALALTVTGGLLGFVILVFTLPASMKLLPGVYNLIRPNIHVLLISVILYMLLVSGKFWKSLLVFLLSGVFGLLVLNSGLINQNFLLLPVFTGLFGASILLLSYNSSCKIPKQKLRFEFGASDCLAGAFAGFLGGLLAGVLPALGSSQSAVLVHEVGHIKGGKKFLTALGAINTIAIILSVLSIYLIGNARSGSAITIQKFLGELSLNTVFLFIALGLFAAGISSIITLKTGKYAIHIIERINYKKLVFFTLCFLFTLTYMFTGLYGVLIFITGTAIGMSCGILGVGRSFAMGVLILPTILFFAGLNPLVILLING